MTMGSFKVWYMVMYWEFDNWFLVAAKFFGITYHEFVLISLCVVWPAITVGLLFTVVKMRRDNLVLMKRISEAS